MADIEQLDRALKWIEENPELHDQEFWFTRTPCGTAMCLAGVIAMLNGWKLLFLSSLGEGDVAESPDGERKHVAHVARELLDLDVIDAERLFATYNTVEDLRRIRDDLVAERTADGE